jgi:hypothetical protein
MRGGGSTTLSSRCLGEHLPRCPRGALPSIRSSEYHPSHWWPRPRYIQQYLLLPRSVVYQSDRHKRRCRVCRRDNNTGGRRWMKGSRWDLAGGGGASMQAEVGKPCMWRVSCECIGPIYWCHSWEQEGAMRVGTQKLGGTLKSLLTSLIFSF